MSKPVPQCETCALGTTCGRLVGTRGPADAPIVVVGRAPSEEEINSGKAFSDGAGQCLEACMKRAGWDAPVLYVNALRCRPPEGTKVSVDMLAHCGDALNYALTYRPRKLIVCLGNEAKAAVLGGTVSGVEKSAGLVRVHPVLGCPVVWTYMPLNVLYRPNLMHQFIGHLQKALCLYRGEDRVDPGAVARKVLVRDVAALRKLVAYCRRRAAAGDTMAFDIETTGLDRFNDKIIGVAFGFGDFGAYVVLRHGRSHIEQQEVLYRGKPKVKDVEVWELVDNAAICGDEGMALLRELLEDPDVPKVAHNVKYDYTVLLQSEGIRVRNIVGDSLMYQLLLDENQPLGLKYISRQLYDAPDYDAELSVYFKGGKNLSMAPLHQVAEYACLDVIYTSLIARHLRYNVSQTPALGVHDNLLLPLSRELGEMELQGMRVDVAAVKQAEERIVKRMAFLEEQVNSLTGFAGQKLPSRGEKDKQIGVNPNSDDDLRYIFFTHFGLPTGRMTESGKPSVDKETRKELLASTSLSPLARGTIEAVGEYSKLNTYLGTFVRGTLDAVRDDGCVHTSFGLNLKSDKVPATGRLSSSSPNIQNVIAGFQPCYVPPDGWRFIQADYRAIEIRVWGALSRDDALIKLFVDPNLDFHRHISAAMLSKSPDEVSNEERQQMKVVAFSTIYGGDYRIISNLVGCSEEEAQLYQERLFATFARGKAWMDEQVRCANENHQVYSPIGRIRHLTDITSANRRVREATARMAQNSVIQGFASDCNLMAMISVADHLRWAGTGAPWLPRDDETSWDWLARRRTYAADLDAAFADLDAGRTRLYHHCRSRARSSWCG